MESLGELNKEYWYLGVPQRFWFYCLGWGLSIWVFKSFPGDAKLQWSLRTTQFSSPHTLEGRYYNPNLYSGTSNIEKVNKFSKVMQPVSVKARAGMLLCPTPGPGLFHRLFCSLMDSVREQGRESKEALSWVNESRWYSPFTLDLECTRENWDFRSLKKGC